MMSDDASRREPSPRAGSRRGVRMSLEQYADISGAIAAWGEKGLDAGALLRQVFGLSYAQFADLGCRWSTKMAGSPALAEKYAGLAEAYRRKHSGGAQAEELVEIDAADAAQEED